MVKPQDQDAFETILNKHGIDYKVLIDDVQK